MNKIHMDLKDFLIRAKKNTYAGDGPKSLPSRPHSKDLNYHEGDYLYIDSYLGGSDFIGEEVVWHQGRILWGMNYYGKSIDGQDQEVLIDFLKQALRNLPESMPLRGPEYFKQGNFEYRCKYIGNMEHFSGEEEILYMGKKVYFLIFHGGIIK